MATHRALVLTGPTDAPQVRDLPAPTATPGSATLRVECAQVMSYTREVYPPAAVRKYPMPYPIVAGSSSVARVASLPPDSSHSLQVGQLALVSPYVRGREDPRAAPQPRYLQGVHEGFTDGSRRLMRDGWRDGGFAQLVRAPLENVFALDEARLVGQLGLEPAQLGTLAQAAVPFGGLRAVGLRAGESVAIAPATGGFGGAAVAVALAMGARVVALGRSDEGLAKVRAVGEKMGRGAMLSTVKMSGSADEDAEHMRASAGMGGLDVFFDISPPEAGRGGVTPAYILGGIKALRHGGRVSLMGGIAGDVALPYSQIMHRDISVVGKWMYEPEDMRDLIKMAEAGVLSFDWVEIVGTFLLDKWQEAWDTAAANPSIGQVTVIQP